MHVAIKADSPDPRETKVLLNGKEHPGVLSVRINVDGRRFTEIGVELNPESLDIEMNNITDPNAQAFVRLNGKIYLLVEHGDDPQAKEGEGSDAAKNELRKLEHESGE